MAGRQLALPRCRATSELVRLRLQPRWSPVARRCARPGGEECKVPTNADRATSLLTNPAVRTGLTVLSVTEFAWSPEYSGGWVRAGCAVRTYVHGQSVILFAESPVIGFIQWFCCSVYEYPGTRTTVQTSRHSYMAGCPCMHGPCVVLRRIGHWIYRVTIASNTHACSSSVLI